MKTILILMFLLALCSGCAGFGERVPYRILHSEQWDQATMRWELQHEIEVQLTRCAKPAMANGKAFRIVDEKGRKYWLFEVWCGN